MSLRELYRTLSTLSTEQRAVYARRVEQSGLGEAVDEILPRPAGGGPVPAALVQQRLWILDQMEPGNPFYNLPLLCFVLAGPLCAAALAASFTEIERRHEALRTTFVGIDGAPFQVIAAPSPRTLPLVDFSALPAAVGTVRAWELARAEARRPFDLARGPLWRTALLRLGTEEHLLLVTLHHVISDAWSLGVLYRELTALYNAFTHGRPSPLPELTVQYPDFALWQRQRLSGDRLAEELEFWRRQLAGAPDHLEIPADHPRPPIRAFRGRRQTLALPAHLPEALAGLGQETGSSLFMLLLAGYGALLHRLTGQSDFVVSAPVAGRGHAGTENLIGFFVNTVILRLRPPANSSWRSFLGQVRDVVLDVYEHQELPFDRLVEELQPRRDPAWGPIFQTMFSLQNTATPPLDMEGLRVRTQGVEGGTSQTDLILFAGMGQGRLGILQMEYDVALFEDPTIQRYGSHLVALLAAAVADPDRPLAALPLLSPAERHQLLREWGGSRLELAAGAPLHQRFAARAAERPRAVAVVCGTRALDYGELNARADRLAGRLRALGVGPEVRVALLIDRSLELVVGILGILKAGGTYVPLDPEYPPERLQYLVDDSQAAVLVGRRSLLPRLPRPPLRQVLFGGDDAETALAGPDGDPPPDDGGVDSANTAYIIYTSGSTGLPKGTLITHGNVTRLLAAAREVFDLRDLDVWTLFHSFAFDFSVWELWGALALGGSVVLVTRETALSPESFLGLLETEGVTVLSQTPSAFRPLAWALAETPAGWESRLALRYVVFGGEALEPAALRPWFERFPAGGPRLVNMYGITETTVHVTWREISASDAMPEIPAGRSPIGAALVDLSLYLLERDLTPVPLGVTGEIHVGGPGLSRGYLGRPELTADRFRPDPFASSPGARLYRSGDLGRYRPSGDLLFLGRADQQIKIRGVRIELGEVETALSWHPAIVECVAALREVTPGELGLVAYYVARSPQSAPEAQELRAFLRDRLPDSHLPAAFMALPQLPLTANGKTDRSVLPAPDRQGGGDSFVAPRTPLEEALAAIWSEVLGVERIGVTDDFFALGGHSLLATRLVARLRDRFQRELSAQIVFHSPTIAALAHSLEKQGTEAGEPEEVPALVALPRRTRRAV
ncbi:MAG TPA: amino acid adenylation domain-containing protein [Thermoanaerobaculia bacterium]|nr:amino acid adenylation domain-containing protein [Thermoanaerobaculia bacterium]